MNRDLEETLNELGPDYRAVVARLRTAREAQDFRRPVFRLRSEALRPMLAAASILILIGLGVFFQTSHPLTFSPSHPLTFSPSHPPTRGAHEYQMDVAEMIATQNADGSWKNDFLTRRNAEALKLCGDPAAQVAYKKAMRNLRTRGVL